MTEIASTTRLGVHIADQLVQLHSKGYTDNINRG